MLTVPAPVLSESTSTSLVVSMIPDALPASLESLSQSRLETAASELDEITLHEALVDTVLGEFGMNLTILHR